MLPLASVSAQVYVVPTAACSWAGFFAAGLRTKRCTQEKPLPLQSLCVVAAEVRCSYYKLGIQAGDQAVLPLCLDLLASQGRMKYLRPLYRLLYASGGQMRQAAIDTFLQSRSRYHPIAAKMCAADLQV